MSDELRAEVRRCLARNTDLRRHLADPHEGNHGSSDASLWRLLAAQMGVAGLVVPEADGGAGGSVAELAVVFEELGAALAPVPMFATVGLALPALLAATGGERPDVVRDLLSGIATGDTVAALAVSETDGGYAPAATTVGASRSGSGWVLAGVKNYVVDGAAADVVLVVARSDEGVGLFAVRSSAPGVRVTTMPSLDLLRPLARVDLTDAPADAVALDAAGALVSALDLSAVLLAAEQVGGAQRCLDMAVEYAKQRVQFGRPIGGFQAIKHQLVDLLLEVEMARSAMTYAVQLADEYLADPSEQTARGLGEAASLARALCSETYSHVADGALHVHGGIGFTWEHDAHLYVRRAKSAELLFGTPDEHRARLATAVGL